MRIAPPGAHAPVVHPHAALALYRSGSAVMWCGARYVLGPGDVLLVPTGMPHYLISSDDGADALAVAVCTACLHSPARAQLAACFAEVAEGTSAQRTLPADEADRLAWVIASLGDELRLRGPHHDLAVEGHLALIAAAVARATPTALPQGDHPNASLSARALRFIAHHAHAGISLVDVARHVHRSAAHTAAVVKADTGHTVVAWITHTRLAAARDLLLRTDDTIEAIAGRVGFKSTSHFHRTFKRHHTTTPAGWRAAHRSV